MMKHIVRSAAVVITFLVASSRAETTFQTLHSFAAGGSQGLRPMGTLTIGPDRSLYGTASEGGALGAGTAFKYNTATGIFGVIGNFETAETGKAPVARLVNLGDGFLYGASSRGAGTAGMPIGTVFKLDPAGGATTAGGLTKLFALPGSGVTPMVPLSVASGEPGVLHVLGSSPGGIWRVPVNGDTPTAVFSFAVNGSQGIAPQSLIASSTGALFGVTQGTGSVGSGPAVGTVFAINPNGSGFMTMHECSAPTGVNPIGGLVEAPDGTFYGTMSSGGNNLDGVIFRLTVGGDYTVLHHVNDNPPQGDLLLASDGRLYGTSFAGGQNLYGSVFRINLDGSGFQVIVNFNKTNGAFPKAGLVQADDGKLYGVTSEGGANNQGTIYQIDLNLPAPAVNRPPVAIIDQAFSSGSQVNIPVLANDFDADEDPLIVSIEVPPQHGTAEVQPNGTITYTPTLNQYQGLDEFVYKITDPDGLSDIATVTVSDQAIPAVWNPGVYNGLLNLDPGLTGDSAIPRAQVVINVNDTGVFTGKLFTQKKRLTVRGFFNQDGVGIGVVTIPRQGKALIFLAAGEAQSLTAVLFGKENWSGFLSPLNPTKPVTDQLFTVSITCDVLSPLGPGFAVMKIFSNGLIGLVGKLGDGTPFSCGTTLAGSGEPVIPVFCEPLKGGVIGGNLGAQVGSPYTYGGSARWIRPALAKSAAPFPFPGGFFETATVLAFPFTPAPRGAIALDFGSDQTGTVIASGGGLGSAQGDVSVSDARLISSGSLKSFAINRNTGIFTGKIKIGTKTVSFQGAVFQSLQAGEGFFFVGRNPGVVQVIAEPIP